MTKVEYKLPKTRIAIVSDGVITEYWPEVYVEDEIYWLIFPFWWKRYTGWRDVSSLNFDGSHGNATRLIDKLLFDLKQKQNYNNFINNKITRYEDYPDD